MKKNVAGVGICGCIALFQPFENTTGRMGHFGGISDCLGAVVGAPRAPEWGNYRSQIWISYYEERNCGWGGDLWLHNIISTI